MSVHAGVILAYYYLCVIIIKVFLKRKILSLETILSAHTHTHSLSFQGEKRLIFLLNLQHCFTDVREINVNQCGDQC